MKYILSLMLCAYCMIGTVNAQKISKKEAKAIVSQLSDKQKAVLLQELLLNDAKLMDKTLLKAMSKATKAQVDKVIDITALGVTKEAVKATPGKPEVTGRERAAQVQGQPKIVPMNADRQVVKTPTPPAQTTEAVDAPADTETPQQPTYVFVDKSLGPLTTISVEQSTFDFGTINDGDVVTHIFKIKNTGKEPLVIQNAKGSCGCTVPEWPREAVAPGATADIKVTFNSSGKGAPGEGLSQMKRVTITANTDPTETYLNVKGQVVRQQ